MVRSAIGRVGKSRLARVFAGTLVVGVVSRLLVLAMAIVLARTLSPDGYGAFTFATGLAALAAQVSGLGWSGLMSRMIPKLRVQEQWSQLRGLLRAGDGIVLAGAVTVAAVIALVMALPAVRPELRSGMGLGILLLLPTAFATMRRNQLAGAHRAAYGIAIDRVLPPAIVIAVVFVLGVGSAAQAVQILAAATLLGALIATFALQRTLPGDVRQASPAYDVRGWMAVALPLLIGQSAKMIMDRTDAVMLGPLSTFEQVGFYGSAIRLTYLMTFPQVMMMAVLTPIFSEKIAQGDAPSVWRHFRIAMVFSVVTAIPLGAGLWIFRDDAIALVFGEAFRPAGLALGYLAASQALFALSIPFSGLLIAMGRTGRFGMVNVAALVANIALNFALIPRMGAQGAAIATALSTLIIAVGMASILYSSRGAVGEE